MSGWRAALCVLVVPVCAAAVPLGGKQAVALLDRVALSLPVTSRTAAFTSTSMRAA